MTKDKITVDQIVELYDPERSGEKSIILVEDGCESVLSTNSVMLWGIGHVPVVGIEVESGLKLWLDDTAVHEEWRHVTQ